MHNFAKLKTGLDEVLTMKTMMTETGLSSGIRPKKKEHVMTLPELNLKKLLPINELNEGAEYILRQQVTGRFVRHEVIRQLYSSHMTERPNARQVLFTFMDVVTSKRLQAHFGQPDPAFHKQMEFGHMPFPKYLWEMYNIFIANVGAATLPDDPDIRQRAKSKVLNARKTWILRCEAAESAKTLEERALAYYFERVSFVHHHRVMNSLCNYDIL